MANTVHGPYTTTSWSGSTGINITRLDNLETSANIGVHSLNPNLSGPYVHSGIACAKDGTVANQLDIASGVAFVTASDGTTIQIDVAADNTHTTSTPSTTYYLFLLNTGAWQWGTTATGPTNSLPICQVATDGSGNISSVTDVRHIGGGPGQPYTISRQLGQVVTVTTDQIFPAGGILAPVRGLYRFSLHFAYRNATPQKVVAFAKYVDPAITTTQANFVLVYPSSNAGQVLNGSQASTIGNNQSCVCVPIEAWCEAGQFIAVHFQDGGGTPNDVINVLIQRIA